MYIFMKVFFKTNLFIWFLHFQTQQLKSYSWFIFLKSLVHIFEYGWSICDRRERQLINERLAVLNQASFHVHRPIAVASVPLYVCLKTIDDYPPPPTHATAHLPSYPTLLPCNFPQRRASRASSRCTAGPIIHLHTHPQGSGRRGPPNQ